MSVLTENAIITLSTCDPKHLPFYQCTLQVLNFKFSPNTTRYRVIISDGTHFTQACLGTKYSNQVGTGGLVKHCILRISEYSINMVHNTRIPLLLEFEVLPGYSLTRIGNPVPVEPRNYPGSLAGTQPSLQSSFQQNRPPTQQHHSGSQQIYTHIQQFRDPIQQNHPPIQQHHAPLQQIQPPIQQIQPPIRQVQPPIQQIKPPIQQIQRPFQQQTPIPPQPQQPLFMQNQGISNFSDSSIRQYDESSLVTIHRLNPYQNRWTIKVRVVQKSEIKTWSNARTEGKLFNVHLLDSSGEIKATVFQNEVDRLYQILVEGQVYYITNGRVVVAKKQFSNLNNEYELILEHGTQVEQSTDDTSIPKMTYSFTKIADIDQKQKNEIIDVLGLVHKDGGLSGLISKLNGTPIKKREIYIVDETEKEIRVTLWGRTAELFDSSDSLVVAFKGLKVNDFGGCNLSLQSSGDIKINPNIPEAHQLQSWYRTYGQQVTYSTFNNTAANSDNTLSIKNAPKMTIADAKDKSNLFTICGTVIYIKTDSYCYAACSECHKKLISEGNSWRCEKCFLDHSAPDYRYLLNFSIQDDTSHMYVMAFHEAAEQLLQKTVAELREKYGVEYLQMVAFDPPIFRTYNFTIRAQQDVYNNVTRTKYVLLEATPVDFIKEGYNLVATIDGLMA